MNETIIAVLSLMIGAILQYIFSRLSKKYDHLNKITSEACIEYFTAITDMKFQKKDMEINKGNYLKAKQKILLFGQMRLVNFLYKFEKTNKVLDNDESMNALSDLLEEMRVNVFNRSTLNKKVIKKILLDLE